MSVVTHDDPPEPEVIDFTDVVVAPYTSLLGRPPGGHPFQGGPRWPHWESQILARHRQRGRPLDLEPPEVDPELVVDEPAMWGGAIVNHFGHLVSEFSMRLLPSLVERPGHPIAFATHPSYPYRTVDDLPAYVRGIHAWVGIEPGGALLVTRPTLFRRLSVCPQPEMLHGAPPTARHLDRMDALTARRLGARPPVRPGVTYVSRAGARHGVAGEAFIEQVVREAGAHVVRPEGLPVADQLRAYATAETLLYAEGSTAHASRLLGRSLGDVVVIRRQDGPVVGEDALLPRVRSLATIDAVVGVMRERLATGAPSPAVPIGILDGPRLRAGLATVLPAVERTWDPRGYDASVDEDVLAYADGWADVSRDRSGVDRPGTWAAMRRVVEEAGLGRLVARLDDIGRAYHVERQA